MWYLTKTTCSSVEKRACAPVLIVTYSLKIFHLTCSKKMNSQCKRALAAHNKTTLDCFNEDSLFETKHLFTVETLFDAGKVRRNKKRAAFLWSKHCYEIPRAGIGLIWTTNAWKEDYYIKMSSPNARTPIVSKIKKTPNTFRTSQREQISSTYTDATDPNNTVYKGTKKLLWKNPI